MWPAIPIRYDGLNCAFGALKKRRDIWHKDSVWTGSVFRHNDVMQDDLPPSPHEYARHRLAPWNRQPRRRRTLAFLILGAVLVLALSILGTLLPHRYSREPASRVMCANNLRQLGLAAILSANQRGGKFPDDLHTIFAENELSTSVLFCPTTMPALQYSATTRQAVEAIRADTLLTSSSPPHRASERAAFLRRACGRRAMASADRLTSFLRSRR